MVKARLKPRVRINAQSLSPLQRALLYVKALPLRALWLTAAALPAPAASRLGGALLALVGPLSRKQHHVMRNLAFVKPEASPAELKVLARGMWRNFGSVLLEMPHLEELAKRMQVEIAPATAALLDADAPVMYLTAHLGNWELLTAFVNSQGKPFVAVYTEDPNPYVDRAIQAMRNVEHGEFVDKGVALKTMLEAGRQRRCIGLLQDVRVDSGVPLPLFGVDTMTTISPARVALKLGYPMVPLQVQRVPGARFRVVAHAPLDAPGQRSEKAQAIALTQAFNRLAEGWIRERPSEWLCTKRRWPKSSRPLATALQATAELPPS